MSNLFITGTVNSQLSMLYGRKRSVQGNEASDITDGDHIVYSAARLCAFPWYVTVAIALFENQNKGESNLIKLRGKHLNTGLFETGLP